MAEHGIQAIKMLRDRAYDLLITDIRMPGMTGLELLAALRQEGNEIDAVVLTGFAEFEYAQQALKLGAIDYLLKPVHQHELIEIVAKGLRANNNTEAHTNNEYIAAAIMYIREHMEYVITIKEVAAYVHLNPSYFSVLFKSEMGMTFIDYVTHLRISKAKELLRDFSLSLDTISERIGLQTTSYFIRIFKKYEQVTPKQYRDQIRQR